jgi:hypothetical protein
LDNGPRLPAQQHVKSHQQPQLRQVQELSREGSRRLVNYSRPISPPQNSPKTDVPPADLPPALLFKRKHQSGWFTGGIASGQEPRGSKLISHEPVASTLQSSPSQVTRMTPAFEPDTNPTQGDPLRSRVVAPVGLASSKWSTPYMHAGTKPFDPHVNDHMVGPQPEDGVKTQSVHEVPVSQQFLAHQARSDLPVQHVVPYKVEPLIHQAVVASNGQSAKAAQSATTAPNFTSSPVVPSLVSSPSPTQHDNLVAQPIHVPESQPPNRNDVAAVISFVPQESCKDPESSISPSHNMKISSDSPTTVINGLRHEPPGRTASPVKSALKQSSGNTSPVKVVTIPDTESAPQHSDLPKRKKSVRIKVDVKPGDDLDMRSSRYAPPTPIKPLHPIHSPDFEEDIDDIMKPTPVLPSFGSIRSQSKDTSDERSAPVPPYQHVHLEDSMTSSDHAIGGILRQSPLAGKGARREDTDSIKPGNRPSTDPLPPEVTSVEGTGFDSNSEEGSVGIAEPLTPVSKEKEPPAESHSVEIQPAPFIDVQKDKHVAPAQPAEAQKENMATVPEKIEWHIPGAFPEEVDELPQETYVPKNKVMFALAPEAASESSSDDDSSIYSDAEEELDGTGFASLDAVMEESSPMAVVAASKSFQESNDHYLSRQENPELEQRLAEAQKNKEEQEKAAVVPTRVEPLSEFRQEAKPQQTISSETLETKQQQVTTAQSAKQPDLSSSKWSPAGKFHSAVGHLKSLRRNSAQSPSRESPIKATSPTRQPVFPLQTATTLRRTNSNDSVSSFKRQRASSPATGRVTLRSSLRSDPHRATSPPRTLSPSESLGTRQRTMRTSLRESTSLTRHESHSPKPSRLSSLIKSSRSVASKVVPTNQTSQSGKYQSRFAHDSDSEPESTPTTRKPYISRFAKNSDENLPLSSPPQRSRQILAIRGIPRRSRVDDDVQSTDLEDESESPNRSPLPPVPTIEAVNRVHSTRHPELSSGAKGSLETSRFAPRATSPSQAQSPHRRWHSVLLFGSSSPPSSARRGASPLTLTSRKLRRRGAGRPMSRERDVTNPSGWPLPEAPKVAEIGDVNDGLKRPESSDGAGKRARIDLGSRRNTTDAVLELKGITTEVATRNEAGEKEPTPTSASVEAQSENPANKRSRFSKWKKKMKLG